MSDEDRINIAGRALLKLKALTTDISMLTVEVRGRNQELSDVSALVTRFLGDPGRREPGAREPAAATIARQLREIDLASLGSKVQELSDKASEARILEEEIKRF